MSIIGKALKLILIMIITLTSLSFSLINPVHADDTVNIYLFWGQGCPHCAKEKEYLAKLKEEYKDQINVYDYEVYYSKENVDLLKKLTEELDLDVGGVPFTIIGENQFIGYDSDTGLGQDIKKEIDKCLNSSCIDRVIGYINNDKILGSTDNTEIQIELIQEENENNKFIIDTKIFGEVDLKSLSLPLATILIAFVDGFNPCAMWILIFLISMLINMKDKKKLYILGSAFIITSGAVYYLFLTAWFNLFQFIGYVYLIKVIIGIVAIISGVIHIKNSIASDDTCHVTNLEQRKSIMDRIKNIIKEKSFILSLLGIITLAVSVNLIELVCSAGLPAIYTNLLSTISLTKLEYYSYLLLYIFIFMLDDLVVFFTAIKTFEVTGLTKKYTKWSGLIGGIVILIIGIILILKPELLMFG